MSYFRSNQYSNLQSNMMQYETGQTPKFCERVQNENSQYRSNNQGQCLNGNNSQQTTNASQMINTPMAKSNSNINQNHHMYEHDSEFQSINNQYFDLRNKVEDRIRMLQTKCIIPEHDPSKTRISFGSNADNNSYQIYSTKKNEENSSINTNHDHRNIVYHGQVRDQLSHVQSRQNLSHQYLRPHCFSIDSNKIPYQSQHRATEPSPMPIFHSQQTLQSGETGRSSSVFNSQSNTSNNTFFQQSISEAILQNLKAQKELNQNLKILSERICDLSAQKRSESSDHQHQTQRQPEDHEKRRNRSQLNREYGTYWRREGSTTEQRKHSKKQSHMKKHQPKYHGLYAQQGYQSSDESQNYSPKIFESRPSNSQAQMRRSDRKRSKYENKQTRIDRSSSQKFNNEKSKSTSRKRQNSNRGRLDSASHSSRGSCNKIYTFRGNKLSTEGKQLKGITRKEKKKTNQDQFNSEYFVSKKTIKLKDSKEGSRFLNFQGQDKKKSQKKQRHHTCPIHQNSNNFKIEQRKERKKNKEVYKDSQYRNRKHEREHLLQSFQQQQKLRRQLLSKIAKNFFNSYGVK